MDSLECLAPGLGLIMGDQNRSVIKGAAGVKVLWQMNSIPVCKINKKEEKMRLEYLIDTTGIKRPHN